jgi:DtxR family Mn-dependent transcriptional regulator
MIEQTGEKYVGKSMSERGTSESVENFVKAVYVLQQDCERVSTNALTVTLKITAPSVTDMAQRLMEGGLLDYRKYYGVRLTEEGEAMALRLVRRHRLIELYLVRELGYALHEVHDEAEKLEHSVSDRFIEAIDEKLGNPEFDPHGDPIPDVDGFMTNRILHALSELAPGAKARVARFLSNDPEMLQHALDRGFVLDGEIEVIACDPFNGPLTLLINEQRRIIGHLVAQSILVEILQDERI